MWLSGEHLSDMHSVLELQNKSNQKYNNEYLKTELLIGYLFFPKPFLLGNLVK